MLIIISGPSCIGKNTHWQTTAESINMHCITPYTTRDPRKDEINRRDYHFISKSEFIEFISSQSLMEWDFFHNHYYGTLKSQYDNINSRNNYILFAMAKIAIKLKSKIPNTKTVLLIPYNQDIIISRLIARGYEDIDLYVRIQHMKDELSLKELFDYSILGAEEMSPSLIKDNLNKIINHKLNN